MLRVSNYKETLLLLKYLKICASELISSNFPPNLTSILSKKMMSPYLPNYQHDIVVSYVSEDNAPDTAWVTALITRLKIN
ncbi:MAG: hypothetical protein VSS75_010455 [Candidatus Parabeggiatoa sp.]|nr:hypothetical protein [Candidatus Parabeggiatoa sp.]